MRALSVSSASGTIETGRHGWRPTDRVVGDVLTEIAKRILWTENTAPCLAAACGCSVRQAERILGGHCEWSGDATAAIISEILERKKMRNVRVTARK